MCTARVADGELQTYNRLIDCTWLTSFSFDVRDGYQESQRDLSDNVSALFRITLRALVVFLMVLVSLARLSQVIRIESGLLTLR